MLRECGSRLFRHVKVRYALSAIAGRHQLGKHVRQSCAQALVNAGIAHVVAVRWDLRVTDGDCRIFATNFCTSSMVSLVSAKRVSHACVVVQIWLC